MNETGRVQPLPDWLGTLGAAELRGLLEGVAGRCSEAHEWLELIRVNEAGALLSCFRWLKRR